MTPKTICHITVVEVLEWFLSDRPNLKHDHPIAPHITGCGVFPIEQSLRCSPLHWNLASTGLVVSIIHQITSHAKVTNLIRKGDLVLHSITSR